MNQEVFHDRDLLAAAAGGPVELAPAIMDRLQAGDTDSILTWFEDQHSADIAGLLASLPPGASGRLLRLLPLDERADVFGYLDSDDQIEIGRALGRREFARIVSEMSPDERADLFNRLPHEQQETLLPALAQAEREDIRRLASYPEGTAGAVMTSDYATLPPHLTAREAIESLRLAAPDKETIYNAYVVDEARRLAGVLSLRDLILAEPTAKIADIMDTNVIHARAEDSRAEVARLVAKYDLIALPIINGGDALVGIVTQDDAMDVAEEEATKDFHKVGTVGALATSLKDASIGLLYRKRITWLVLLVFFNIFSGAGLALFERTIVAHVALVFFLPLLIAGGGNAGAQASTLMVRALATGDVRLADWGQMLGRELLVAAALGLTMAAAVAGIGAVRGGPQIALVVAATMVLVVITGSIVGMSLPFLLSRFKLDPASASAPLITSIADVAGVVIYLGIATAVLMA
ncbi:MAG: magnesium transporter [Hyphomicrobiaceae bacterium]|nr:magnesium transporter [Hyphomicrobiaceae bacterium]